MVKTRLNLSVVFAAQWPFGFVLELLIFASRAIELQEAQKQSLVLEWENALWTLSILQMEMNTRLDVVFAETVVMNRFNSL